MSKYDKISTKDKYESVIKTGMFWEWYPELSGIWFDDQKIINSRPTKICFFAEIGDGRIPPRNHPNARTEIYRQEYNGFIMTKICFFTEVGDGTVPPRNHPNLRTELAWMCILNAPNYPLQAVPQDRYDLGIVIIPKKNADSVDINSYRTSCDTIAVMQEGPHWNFQDYSIAHQFGYYNNLINADIMYCHNTSDVDYYNGIGLKDVRVMRSLMIPEGLAPPTTTGTEVMIGGNFVSWYSGFDSYILAKKTGLPIVAPSMGRKQSQEDLIEDIQYLPYMYWRQWIQRLGQAKIGIHMMRTHAAGTFAMNCAYNGIPCIGYYGLDTQEILHPFTTVKIGDMASASINVDLLCLGESEFYKQCSEITRTNFDKYYSEVAWKSNWNDTNPEFRI